MKKGVLKAFNSGTYLATVELSGSGKAYIEDVAVARNISSALMVLGRKVAVFFFDEHNVKEAVVVAVYV